MSLCSWHIRWARLFDALARSPIQRIDLFRYLAIEHYGGFYLDLDIILSQPLDELLSKAGVSVETCRFALCDPTSCG